MNYSDYSPYINAGLGGANTGLSIYQGATSGNPVGQTRAGLTAAKTYGNVTGAGGINAGATGALDALNIYQGINQGGVRGYGSAAGSGLQLAGLLSSNPALSTVGGYVMAPLAIYNAVENYQSGKTGSDALNGAEAGAAVGSIIPGIGTVIGGLVGGAVGALSSAFGPGAKDPETSSVQGLIDYTSSHGNTQQAAANDPNPYLSLAGLMDRRSSTLPMYQQYGRMGEKQFTTDLAKQINEAFTSGQGIQAGPMKGNVWSKDAKGDYVLTTPTGGTATYAPDIGAAEVYNTVVDPWVGSMGSGYKNVGDAYTATTQGLLKDMTSQYLSGQAADSWKATGGDSPFSGIYQNSPLAGAHQSYDQQIAQQQAQQAQQLQQQTQAARESAMGAGAHYGVQMRAKGGHIQDNLRHLYKGSFAKRHYDDGGSVDYFTPQYSSFDPALTDYGALGTGATDTGNPYSAISQVAGSGDNIVNAYNDPYAYSSSSGGGSSSGAGSSIGALGTLLKGLGVGGSTLSSLAPYAALLPLLQSALGGNKGASQPSLPSQFSGPVMNMQTPPAYNRQQVPLHMGMDQWLHSAEGPEINFYNHNALPTTPMSAAYPQSPYTGASVNPYSVVQGSATVNPGNPYSLVNPGGTMQAQPINPGDGGLRPIMKKRGGLACLSDGGPTTFNSTGSGLGGLGHVKGPGDGTSDDIRLRNAYLSNGEYVIDAPTVSAAGNGSNDAGARVFDRIRSDIRKHAGKPMAKGKQPMTAKKVDVRQYMGGVQ